MKFFIILNLLILTIILLRYLVDGRITRRQQYAMWIAIPVFVSLFFFVRIPLQVRTEVKKEMINVPSETIIKTEENTEIDSTSVIVEDSYNAQVNETPVVNQENHNNEYNQNISNFSEISDYHKSQEPVKTDKVIDYSSILKLIWILGASLIGLAITIKNSIFGIRIIKNREYYTRSNPGNLKVYKLNKISSPFLFGNSIYIDKKMQENSKEYLHAICHEYSHFKSCDSLWLVVKYVFFVVFWFDPIVWIASAMIKQDSEMAADESAIAILGEEYRTEYGETLLSFISQRSNFSNLMVLSTSMSGKNKTFMKSRIVNIKNGTRRSVATIIIISMVLTMIVGCSLFDTNKVKAASYVDESDVWYEYSLTTYCDDLNDELNADGVYGRAELITTDVRVFSVGANDAYNENYPATTMLASYTPDGDLIGIINIDSSEYYVGSLFECNGEIMGVVNDMMTSDFKLVSLDFNNGEIVNKCNISSICSRNLSFINNVKSNNSLIYIEYSYLTSSESKVGFLIMDMDGNVQVDVESDFKNVNWTIDGSGNIFCVDCDFEESNQTYTYYVIDLSTGEISLNPANINPEYNFFLSGDYLYLINLDGSIDRYSFITGEIEEIYNSNCSFFNSNEFSCFIMAYCDTDTMIFIRMGGSITRNLDLCGKQILTLTRADSNPNARKQILTAAVLSYADGYAISSFNENNDSYMIQIDNRYNIWNDYMSSDYYTRLSNLIDCIESDIEAGIGPDLIFGNVTDEKLFSADYVMDLNSFVDGTNGLNREEYYTNIIECASKEDKLYQMPVYYSLSGILVDPSLIDESSYGFTYSEYYEFGEEYGYSTIFDTKINAFENLYSFSDQDFCDENGAFDVNNDDFRDLIIVSEACESGRHNNDSAYVIYIMNMIHFLSYQMYSRYTDWQLLGMPSRYGNGPSINIANSIAITKCSSDSEAAWEFIKYELSEEVQSDCEYLPVNKIAFMNSANAAVAYANEYIYYTRGKTDYYSYDFVEIMNAWVLRSNEVVYMNNNLKYDVCQVVNDYFHGAYDSIDEVIAVIEG